ncbi:MAG: phage tail sheath family protein [Desulfovibrio sp.]|nr:phage tail sheath family protein [Desulfovibrio sp.]
MTTGYRHGIYTNEQATTILPARTVDSAVVFAVGTSAVHRRAEGAEGKVNVPHLFYSYEEFVEAFGWDADNFSAYSLQELAYSHFALYRGAPMVCVNVFDPATHASETSDEELTFSTALLDRNTAPLAHAGVRDLTLTSQDGTTTYEQDKDYTLDAASGLLTRLEDGAIAEGGTAKASYAYADVSKVTVDDVIGGIDPTTGSGTGLELIDEVFPRYRLVPSLILCPQFCEDPSVAIVMAAKCDGINGLFKAICLVDIPSSGPNAVTRYTDVPGYKEKNNLTDSLMLVCWPKVRLGDDVYGLATHLAGVIASNDADHEGVPYASPSNKRLEITSSGYEDAEGNWQELWLDLPKVNYLNGQGIYTVNSFDGGLKTWGGRTACYPSNTDPKDCQDAIRRFFNWYQVQFILTYFVKVDEPMTRRLVQTILKSEQIKLDGFTAREIILGGSITFDQTKNPTTDLIDGIMRFNLRITPPPAARDIEGTFEFDTDNLQALFG